VSDVRWQKCIFKSIFFYSATWNHIQIEEGLDGIWRCLICGQESAYRRSIIRHFESKHLDLVMIFNEVSIPDESEILSVIWGQSFMQKPETKKYLTVIDKLVT
jgi:hypothetical protein